jgi:hypothetical protein
MPIVKPIRRLILDQLDALPLAWYGVRHVSRQYQGPLMQVVRTVDGLRMDAPANGDGTIDMEAVLQFARVNGVVGTVTVSQLYDLTGNGRDMKFAVGRRPQIVRAGYVNTIAGLPAMVATGDCLGMAAMPFTWGAPLVFNGVLAVGSAPLSKAYCLGADTPTSSYRDLQISLGTAYELGLGEDLASMTPNAAKLSKDTVSIVTAIRNATGTATRGYLKQNGQLISTFTGENQNVDITPNRLVAFGDPDRTTNYMPLGSAWQEFGVFNAQTPPSGIALLTLELNQGAFYNIPLFGTLAWPIEVSRKIIASNGNPLVTNTGARITYR